MKVTDKEGKGKGDANKSASCASVSNKFELNGLFVKLSSKDAHNEEAGFRQP